MVGSFGYAQLSWCSLGSWLAQWAWFSLCLWLAPTEWLSRGQWLTLGSWFSYGSWITSALADNIDCAARDALSFKNSSAVIVSLGRMSASCRSKRMEALCPARCFSWASMLSNSIGRVAFARGVPLYRA